MVGVVEYDIKNDDLKKTTQFKKVHLAKKMELDRPHLGIRKETDCHRRSYGCSGKNRQQL